ncbi:hypothetical protein [Shewanella phaeophyticola]|uniref:Uncharacterized protein n=1 Tax=Shewanella phaeophyticola TaxID=2978345 RepID=A0ABT2P864_9GAMM|nr:hypothetical protein [Shewanella sp. KJ10-1]MCT8987476.1 hypothetical protein [Shewanella sp. KJ10-1]
MKVKMLDPKGNFDLRAKGFTEFKRANNLKFKVEKTGMQSDLTIQNSLSKGEQAEQIIIVAKGDNSGARSLFRHIRNSIAHANVNKIRVKGRVFKVESLLYLGLPIKIDSYYMPKFNIVK